VSTEEWKRERKILMHTGLSSPEDSGTLQYGTVLSYWPIRNGLVMISELDSPYVLDFFLCIL